MKHENLHENYEKLKAKIICIFAYFDAFVMHICVHILKKTFDKNPKISYYSVVILLHY